MRKLRTVIVALGTAGLLAISGTGVLAAPANFEGAYASEREAFAHMFMTGQVLAAGIVGQMPDTFPTTAEPSDTAMAPAETVSPLALIGTALVALTALTLTRRTLEVRARVN